MYYGGKEYEGREAESRGSKEETRLVETPSYQRVEGQAGACVGPVELKAWCHLKLEFRFQNLRVGVIYV